MVTASFEFDVPVRFDSDAILTTMQSYGVQLVEEIALIEVSIWRKSARHYHLRGYCWLITLVGGSKLGFTDHNNNIFYEGVNYRCGESIFMSSVLSLATPYLR